ncbi:MAG: 23S rRNA (adenine(2030)-N(6))-methyltransferase RlmJ [Chromatiales bacterium]|nr:23S rRNA (adenine(2030)-N(6))-methyltransferase RlmJ [Chromatiales bacterium]
MLSYQHAFHAGNFADVHKHAVISLVLDALLGKDKPMCVLDTHAGAGLYDLTGPQARKTAEADVGIGRLWQSRDLPDALTGYLAAVRAHNPPRAERPRFYPGSPELVRERLRAEDRLVLCEMHPREHDALKALFRDDRRVAVHRQDGYQALKAFLPPKEKRGLVIIDPPYERKEEYTQVEKGLTEALGRWPTGVYALWYPLLAEGSGQRMLRRLIASLRRPCLRCELLVRPERVPLGLNGSGMLIVNPPWKLDEALNAVLPWLWKRLSPEGTGDWRLEWLVRE